MSGRVEDRLVDLPGRTALSVRTHLPAGPSGPQRVPFLLVHGLASNARLWDGVAAHLVAAGHSCHAVDQRGHGRSAAPDGGYDTDTCADDLAALVDALALAAPVVAGQSWGGNVVLSLAARHPGTTRAVACVDGGWIRLRDRFETFQDCWRVLAPPSFERLRWDEVKASIRAAHPDWPAAGVEGTLANLVHTPGGGVRARLAREHHREILRSLYEGDPATWYPRIDVPVLLVPASDSADPPDGVQAALAALPDARIAYYPGAHHDVHAQHPDRLAADLLALAAAATDR